MLPNRHDVEPYCDVFFEALKKATQAMPEEYFCLPVSGEQGSIYRERVYCYELYHQLRLSLPDDYPYSLGGEIHKRGHPNFQGDNLRDTIPDLLVHKAGTMKGNLLIMEVKSIRSSEKDLIADLLKIESYINEAGYYRGVLLVYGDRKDLSQSFQGWVSEAVRYKKLSKEILERINLYHHLAPKCSASLLEWFR